MRVCFVIFFCCCFCEKCLKDMNYECGRQRSTALVRSSCQGHRIVRYEAGTCRVPFLRWRSSNGTTTEFLLLLSLGTLKEIQAFATEMDEKQSTGWRQSSRKRWKSQTRTRDISLHVGFLSRLSSFSSCTRHVLRFCLHATHDGFLVLCRLYR